MLAIIAAVLLFCTGVSYLQGRNAGKEACETKYAVRDAKHQARVTEQLADIIKQNSALEKKWDAQNDKTNETVETQVKTVYKTLEKLVEVPVYVEGTCDIDYAGVASVLDSAARATFPDNGGNSGETGAD
jgi:hypothetical protein